LFADSSHFQKQLGENAARAIQRIGQRISAGNGVADAGDVGSDTAVRYIGFSLPGAADVDTGIGLDGQPVTEFGECLVRELWLEEHGNCPLSVVRRPSINLGR
jgi:hypothetical protein